MKSFRLVLYTVAFLHIFFLSIALVYMFQNIITEKNSPPIIRDIKKSVERAYELAPGASGEYKVETVYSETGNSILYEITAERGQTESSFNFSLGLSKYITEEAELINFNDYKIIVRYILELNHNHSEYMFEVKNYLTNGVLLNYFGSIQIDEDFFEYSQPFINDKNRTEIREILIDLGKWNYSDDYKSDALSRLIDFIGSFKDAEIIRLTITDQKNYEYIKLNIASKTKKYTFDESKSSYPNMVINREW